MNKKNNLPKRFLSRLIAVQTFWQFDFSNQEIAIEDLSKTLIANYFLSEDDEISSYEEKIDQELLQSLLSGLMLVLDKIDDEITPFLKDEWKMETLPDVMPQILRLATFELKFMKDIPLKVVISQYVDLAASFFDDKKVTFVNSILQNIANKNRK
ncbi:MAG: N utilization substance protein B [Lentimonas sp.]